MSSLFLDNDLVPVGVRKKAELLCQGEISIPREVKLPFFLGKCTAGPTAGKPSLILSFHGMRIKLNVVKKENAEFSLLQEEGRFKVVKNGRPFIEVVEILPALFHSPSHSFINLHSDCIYDCAFCASPRLERNRSINLGVEEAVDLIVKASQKTNLELVAITSGIPSTPSLVVKEMIEVILRVKERLKHVRIGVEPYISNVQDIERLYEAGVEEIKLNIQSYDREIFKKVCPKLDYDLILEMIRESVKIFGQGKVCSNIILGFGEEDNNVLEGIKHLAELGAVASLREVRVNGYNRLPLMEALGQEPVRSSPERLLYLALQQKKIFERYGLNIKTFKTMCHSCGCCDIVPFLDV